MELKRKKRYSKDDLKEKQNEHKRIKEATEEFLKSGREIKVVKERRFIHKPMVRR